MAEEVKAPSPPFIFTPVHVTTTLFIFVRLPSIFQISMLGCNVHSVQFCKQQLKELTDGSLPMDRMTDGWLPLKSIVIPLTPMVVSPKHIALQLAPIIAL